MGTKYKQRYDGEGWSVKSGKVHRIACCACGSVHDVVMVHDNGGEIGIAVKRNNRATAQRRRNRKTK